jgi:hypothetical protein
MRAVKIFSLPRRGRVRVGASVRALLDAPHLTSPLRGEEIARFVAIGCLCVLLAGCTDYYDHNDHLTPYSGEGIAANRVAQMVDPWPTASRSPRYGVHGERMLRAISNYKTGTIPSASSSSSGSSGESAGNGEESDNGSSGNDSSGTQN